MMWVDGVKVSDHSGTAGNRVQSQRSGRIEWEALFFALRVGVIGSIGEITVLIGLQLCTANAFFQSYVLSV